MQHPMWSVPGAGGGQEPVGTTGVEQGKRTDVSLSLIPRRGVIPSSAWAGFSSISPPFRGWI